MESLLARLRSLVAEVGAPVEIAQPTPTRVDVLLTLPGAEETERLRHVQGATYRVSLAHEDEIDGELTEWLRRSAAHR
jgi:hypothetical protein